MQALIILFHLGAKTFEYIFVFKINPIKRFALKVSTSNTFPRGKHLLKTAAKQIQRMVFPSQLEIKSGPASKHVKHRANFQGLGWDISIF